MKRRSFLTKTLAGSAIVGSGLLSFKDVMAGWNKSAMHEKDAAKLTKGMASDKIKIKAPAVAENGAVVPIEVNASALGTVESIAILMPKNPRVLGATFNFSNGAGGFAATRFKMAKSGNVVVVVKAGGKYYKAHKEVKVTIGGCGG